MRTSRVLLAATAAALTWSMPAGAQTAPPSSGGLESIVVTARKREESLISVPVVVSAISTETLQKYGVTSLDEVARMVPQLLIGAQGGSLQGGNVSIRGIAGPDSNPFGDQAVSFNIDGVAISMATVRRIADTDMGQVEVLKGPQALFYGKNSPGGVVSIKSADPTNHFESGATFGYEAVGTEFRGDGYVSGPVSDSLGLRLAGFYSHTKGWLPDATFGTASAYAVDHPDDGRATDFGLRGTVKWDPGSSVDAKLKLNYGYTSNDGLAALTVDNSCPFGVRQTGSGLPCGVGNYSVNAGYGTLISTLGGTQNTFKADGQNFEKEKQLLGGLELNYRPSDALKLTSVTGYYWVNSDGCQNFENDTVIILPSCGSLIDHQISEELRFTSDYDGPVNFASGAYFSHSSASSGSITYLFGGFFDLFGPGNGGGPTTPAVAGNYFFTQHASAYSGYLQMIYKPISVVEIDVGGRYSHEKKSITLHDGGGVQEPAQPLDINIDPSDLINLSVHAKHWNDFSPEVTISYRPSDELTFFGSYKHGFLSGGFNSSSTLFTADPDLSYNPETIKGFEIGAKSLLFDRTLSLNLAGYVYKGSGLQETSFTGVYSSIHNAAAAKIKGVEGDFNYKTMITGLGLHGAAAYNSAKYTNYPNAVCYIGEKPSDGCTIVNGSPQQSLTGQVLPRAPKWNLSGGISFDTPLPADLKLGLSGDVQYSSSYLTDVSNDPRSRNSAYTLLNAAAHLSNSSDVWDVAVVGKNLTDKLYFAASPNVPIATGGGTGTAAGVLGDRFTSVSRGREVWMKVSYKFGG